MKSILLVLAFGFSTAYAQTAAVKDIPADGDTTISVTKGNNAIKDYEITEGKSDIEGDPEILGKEARNSWKKACDDWKKETKEMNKENQLLSLTCNSPTCTKNGTTEIVCKSEGTYKIKTKVK